MILTHYTSTPAPAPTYTNAHSTLKESVGSVNVHLYTPKGNVKRPDKGVREAPRHRNHTVAERTPTSRDLLSYAKDLH